MREVGDAEPKRDKEEAEDDEEEGEEDEDEEASFQDVDEQHDAIDKRELAEDMTEEHVTTQDTTTSTGGHTNSNSEARLLRGVRAM